jgi:hypothetical protein
MEVNAIIFKTVFGLKAWRRYLNAGNADGRWK